VPKLPEPPPPGELAARLAPQPQVLKQGGLLWRIYFRGGKHPLTWNEFRSAGEPTSRFDHRTWPPPTPPDGRRILYCAKDVHTPFAECFQQTREIDCERHEPWLVAFEVQRDIVLLDLTGDWPIAAGTSQAISSGPHARARRWSQRIHGDYPAIDGLCYLPSTRGAKGSAIALYERAEDALPLSPALNRALLDPTVSGVVATAASLFGYDVRP
jgi:hypothetical protein